MKNMIEIKGLKLKTEVVKHFEIRVEITVRDKCFNKVNKTSKGKPEDLIKEKKTNRNWTKDENLLIAKVFTYPD